MGRSGGGGGGFSGGGFGGGHNTGGFSGGGRSSGGSFSGGNFGNNNNNNYHNYGYGYGYGGYGRRRRYGGFGGFGCSSGIITVVIIAFIALFIFASVSSQSSSVPQSTKNRTALTGAVEKTDWFKDEPGWISSKNVLIGGMEEFYKKTGVQPYVILYKYDATLWNEDGTLNPDKADGVLEKFYKDNFKDEAHFVFAYFQCKNDSKSEMDGEFRYLSGYAADTVMDSEAIDIFWGYFNINYYDTSLTTEQMISDTFESTANNIMGKKSAVKLPDGMKKEFVIGFAVIVIVVIALITTVIVVAKKKKIKEDENPM